MGQNNVLSGQGLHILRDFSKEVSLSQTMQVTLPIWKLPIIGALVIFDSEAVSFTRICEISLNDMSV
jgi:hypothetical protein